MLEAGLSRISKAENGELAAELGQSTATGRGMAMGDAALL